jgi:hypothetical protein
MWWMNICLTAFYAVQEDIAVFLPCSVGWNMMEHDSPSGRMFEIVEWTTV